MPRKHNKDTHKHIVGLLYNHDHADLATVEDLQKHTAKAVELNESIRRDPCFSELVWMLRPFYTMRQYGDWRCSTDLHRFMHCPECGAAINWRKIREIPDPITNTQ